MLTETPLKIDESRYKSIWSTVVIVISVLLAIVAVYAIRMADPYVRDVLHLDGNVSNGQAIFQMNCAGCHGSAGVGNVGPNLHNVSNRKSQIAIIRQVTEGQTPPMPKFQASPEEMSDLLSYLNTL